MLSEKKINNSTLGEKFNILKSDIKAFLRFRGFTEVKNQYIYKSDSNYIVLNFQKSNTSNKKELKFTINCGIYSNVIGDYQKFEHKTVSIENCHWNKRIGFFTKENKDIWYHISEKTTPNSKEIISILENLALPELFILVDDKELLRTWEADQNTFVTEFNRLYFIYILNKYYNFERTNQSLSNLKDYSMRNLINLKAFINEQ
jgi:hypothetical protein